MPVMKIRDEQQMTRQCSSCKNRNWTQTLDVLSPDSIHSASIPKQHTVADGMMLNIRTSHEASARYATNLDQMLTTVEKLQSWIRSPLVQPSPILTSKFMRPIAVKILDVLDAHRRYRALREQNASDLSALEALDPHATEDVVHRVVTTNLRHLNDTSSYAISPLLDSLRALHALVRNGTGGLGLSKGLPTAVTAELGRMNFQSDVADGWTTAFEHFWIAGGGAVVDLEKRTWKPQG